MLSRYWKPSELRPRQQVGLALARGASSYVAVVQMGLASASRSTLQGRRVQPLGATMMSQLSRRSVGQVNWVQSQALCRAHLARHSGRVRFADQP